MSDEEDTAILLSNGTVNAYKEITIVMPLQNSPKKYRHSNHTPKSLQITTVVTFIAGFIYGYDMPNVLCYLAEYANTFELSCIYQSFLLVAWGVGGVVALIIAAITSLQCRRSIMIYSIIIILIGTLMTAISPCMLLVYCGRALIGFGCVFSASAHCCHVCELSDEYTRGFRISFLQFGISIGVFVCLITAYFFKSSEYGWRFATALNVIPIMIHLLLTTLFVPKLTNNNNDQQQPLSTRTIINNTHDNDDDNNWSTISSTRRHYHNNNNGSLITIYGSFLALFIITLGGHLSGRQSILSYAPTAFIKLGIDPMNAQQSVSITVSIVRVICTGISLNIIDKLGRKPTLLMSILIMFTSGLILLLILLPNNYYTDIKTNIIKYGDYCPYFRVIDSTGLFTFGAREQQMQLISQDMSTMNIIINKDQQQQVLPPFPMLPTPLSLITDSESSLSSNGDNTSMNVLSVIIILVFEAAHALGPSTVMWTLIIEMLPFDRRCSGLMYIISIFWIFDMGFSAYLSIFTQFFSDQIFNKDFFECSLIFCVTTIVLIHLVLPETKCKTLNDIQINLYNNCYLTTIINILFNNNNNNNNILNCCYNTTNDDNVLSTVTDDSVQQRVHEYKRNNNNNSTTTTVHCCTTTTINKSPPVQETVI